MRPGDRPLPRALVHRILDRLEVAPPPATLDGLRQVYSAWSRAVPFDNSRKLVHVSAGYASPLPGDDPSEFFEAWLRWGTGGTCWAGNGALCELLRALGFEAERGVATMLIAPDLPPNHGTVVVRAEGRRWLADASMLHGDPLALEDEAPTSVDHPAWGVDCDRRDERWHVQWRPLHIEGGLECRLDHVGASAEEFRRRHDETRGWSPFNYQLNVRRNVGERVVGLAFGYRVEIDEQGRMLRTEIDDAGRRRVLVEELGLHPEIVERIPEDRPTPPPPFSRTAAGS